MSVGTDDIFDDAVTDAKLSLDSVYTVWRESIGVENLSRILFKRNTISFDPSIILSSNAYFGKTAVAAAGYNVYVVWRERIPEGPANGAIWYRRSIDGGANFGDTVNLRTATTGDSSEPSIAASGNNVYVVWDDNITATQEIDILYRRSIDGGANFGDTVNLTENTASAAQETAIAASGNNVYVVWQDDSLVPGNVEILYRRSTNGGANFGGTVNLSNSVGSSFRSAITASGNNVYVVWNDTIQAGGIQSDILYRRSTNGGANFGGTVNLSKPARASARPSIAASNNLT
jgi:ethanolamine utilization microcompartment shell protein EutL